METLVTTDGIVDKAMARAVLVKIRKKSYIEDYSDEGSMNLYLSIIGTLTLSTYTYVGPHWTQRTLIVIFMWSKFDIYYVFVDFCHVLENIFKC